ncbi:MAG: hypothetical protein NTV34_16775 [Proteobacteria bacterium]|nr:hypothetical protein [Pseudomonadota bacterium]
MKNLFLTTSLILLSHYAYGCPNLSGEYQFENPWNGLLTITQAGCDVIDLRFKKPPGEDFTSTYQSDGDAYEGYYNYGSTSIPAKTNSSPFYKAKYSEDGISMQTFSGTQSECRDTYSFTAMDNCKKFENRLKFDPRAGTYMWTQIGYVRTPSSYSTDNFSLKKIR